MTIRRCHFIWIILAITFFWGQYIHSSSKKQPIAMVIHGGAGKIVPSDFSEPEIKAYKAMLRKALEAGYELLKKGGSSLDAVEKTVSLLEDSPLFNAGKGAVFTHGGKNELDASIMDGKTRNAGAVAGVKQIRNPIQLARLVMTKSKHVLLSGSGAELFARDNGMPWVNKKYFYTKKRWESLQRIKKNSASRKKMGTVGCVALDMHGNLAAGTSTGGMTNKRFGRVGDSPIIGAGTFADNRSCAISSTGHGEFFIRWVVAYDISALMTYKGLTLESAADLVINGKLKKAGGRGGVIGIDRKGNICTAFNTEGMFRGWVDRNGRFQIKMFED